MLLSLTDKGNREEKLVIEEWKINLFCIYGIKFWGTVYSRCQAGSFVAWENSICSVTTVAFECCLD